MIASKARIPISVTRDHGNHCFLLSFLTALSLGVGLWSHPLFAQSQQQEQEQRATLGNMYDEFTLTVTGDAMVQMPATVLQNDRGFMGVVNEIRKGDAAFTNVGVNVYIQHTTGPSATSGNTYITADPAFLKGLRWMGLNLLGAADNHVFDYGVQGILDEIHALEQLDGSVYAGIGETLGEARRPAYLFTPHGRVGFINLVSTFQQSAPAGDPRPDMRGRPGVNPLRHQTIYNVDPALFESLRKYTTDQHIASNPPGIDRVIPPGTPAVNFPTIGDPFDKYSPLTFQPSDKPGVITKADPTDVAEITRSVKDAKVMSDYVVTSIHAHEAINGNNLLPAQFLVDFAHATIDAGSDVFVADGPERPKGIEIYKGKPIFYSVGVLFYQNEMSQGLPQDFYNRYGLGADARPSEGLKARGSYYPPQSVDDPRYWTFVGRVVFRDRRPVQVIITPVQLSLGNPLTNFPDRGIPRVAEGARATKILQYFQTLCDPYGTKIDIKNGIGTITIP